MTRVNLVLLVALLLSAVWLIRSSDEARDLFVQLERAQVRERELQVDFERLKIERRTAATPLVVEDMVRTKLRMFNAGPAVTHYVTDTPADNEAAVVAVAASAAERAAARAAAVASAAAAAEAARSAAAARQALGVAP